jgi:hypothetical protein
VVDAALVLVVVVVVSTGFSDGDLVGIFVKLGFRDSDGALLCFRDG